MPGHDQLTTETSLMDLYQLRHPHTPQPPTYNHGLLTIDLCLGSPEFVSALQGASIMPFGLLVHLSGDYQTLLLDFDSRILVGNAPPSMPCVQTPTITCFSENAGEQCDLAMINEHITAIKTKDQLTANGQATLNAINNNLTQILVKADWKYHKFNDVPWTPTLHLAYLEHQYWHLHLSEFCTK